MHEPILMQHAAVKAYQKTQVPRMTQTAQAVASRLLDELSSLLRPGITENEMQDAVQELLQTYGVEKNWHRPSICFGTHAVLTAYDSKLKGENFTLGEEDMSILIWDQSS